MSLVAAIREMLAKGLSIEQALEAAELVESREEARRVRKRAKEAAEAAAVAAKEEARREKTREGNAQRQRAWRQRNANNALSRVTGVTPLSKQALRPSLKALRPSLTPLPKHLPRPYGLKLSACAHARSCSSAFPPISRMRFSLIAEPSERR
jgi:hypothetical protein